ncbi:nitrate reductase molybdenum cofactor assembly chaperone [Brevibacillus sp. SYSU BS000544]|uniref:nitrate reductase molybdenum cofactor assembly chaperone n=1 Tax=Brevibacillus sp. SYSU BS000544 TaxID=3416443 RepID=UPI003CE540DF
METTLTSTHPTESNEQRMFQFLSVLLQYPEGLEIAELREEANTIADTQIKQLVTQFIDYLASTNEEALTETYVNTFDFNSASTLYLTYSNLGEERERGQVLVQLKELYDAIGFELVTEELPDYFPLVLEIFSVAPKEVVQTLTEDFRPGIEKLHAELVKAESPYASLIEACQIHIEQYVK